MVGSNDTGLELEALESAAEVERRGGDHGYGFDGLGRAWDVAIELSDV